jgi:hypothetical protein
MMMVKKIQSDGNATNNLRDAIAKLFQIENLITHAGFQARELSTCLIGAVNKLNTESINVEDLALMDQMTTDELRRMAGLEHEGRLAIENWKVRGEENGQIVKLAKARIEQEGREVQ